MKSLQVASGDFVRYFVMFFVVLMGCGSPVFAGGSRSIVYEDSYIWYLSERLANQHMGIIFKEDLPLDVDYQLRWETALFYHHRLIECDGPLDEIAQKLNGAWEFYADKDYSVGELLHFLGRTDKDVWLILNGWNAKVLPKLAEVMGSGGVSSVFPSCINKNYVMPIVRD
ncbi:hypothetical protein [Burkholderia sp. GS2Y]|uniref:Lipoprotein n=1 Tax=Burkholderia theae TaxID=3143496 RepID=A0ABU9WKF7_9BURK